MDTMIEYMGETPAVFLSNGLNNMFWWAIQEQVTELWSTKETKVNAVGGLKCYALAMSLTALSVIVFALNNANWERFLDMHGGKSSDAPRWGWQMLTQKKRPKTAKLRNVIKFITGLRSSKRLISSSSGISSTPSFASSLIESTIDEDEEALTPADAFRDPSFVFTDDKSNAGPFMKVDSFLNKAFEERLGPTDASAAAWEERLHQTLPPNMLDYAPESAPERKQWYRDIARWATHRAGEPDSPQSQMRSRMQDCRGKSF
mmetsp:Transcript_75461/g.130789  ORF Transcript_75461/g.130789 Transcript_75461/m.130789 type:complete len:260 (-) Transcript_75461:95-874(-)